MGVTQGEKLGVETASTVSPKSPFDRKGCKPSTRNAASESDTIATYRGETLCMHGIVGDLAKWTVVETKHGNPSLYLRP
jgi:hypothetical protein